MPKRWGLHSITALSLVVCLLSFTRWGDRSEGRWETNETELLIPMEPDFAPGPPADPLPARLVHLLGGSVQRNAHTFTKGTFAGYVARDQLAVLPLWPWRLAFVICCVFCLRACLRRPQFHRTPTADAADDRSRRCRECGYDLRATPARCPECGAAAEAS